MLYYFIFVMMSIGAAKQRRNGIAEPRSGRSDVEGERERWRGGAGAGVKKPTRGRVYNSALDNPLYSYRYNLRYNTY